MANNKFHDYSYYVSFETGFDFDWTDWLNDINTSRSDKNKLIVSGISIDQSSLFGLFKRIRDTGALLVSVNRMTRS